MSLIRAYRENYFLKINSLTCTVIRDIRVRGTTVFLFCKNDLCDRNRYVNVCFPKKELGQHSTKHCCPIVDKKWLLNSIMYKVWTIYWVLIERMYILASQTDRLTTTLAKVFYLHQSWLWCIHQFRISYFSSANL